MSDSESVAASSKVKDKAAKKKKRKTRDDAHESNAVTASSLAAEDKREEESSQPDDEEEEKNDKKVANKSDVSVIRKNDADEEYIELSHKRRVTVRSWHGSLMIDIREYYEHHGDMKAGNKGISLNMEQWKKLKQHIADIDTMIQHSST